MKGLLKHIKINYPDVYTASVNKLRAEMVKRDFSNLPDILKCCGGTDLVYFAVVLMFYHPEKLTDKYCTDLIRYGLQNEIASYLGINTEKARRTFKKAIDRFHVYPEFRNLVEKEFNRVKNEITR